MFSIDGKNIGGLDTFIYYPDQPEYQLDPNHSSLMSSKKLKNTSAINDTAILEIGKSLRLK